MFTLYIIQSGNRKKYKIGYTGNLKNRMAELQTGNPDILHLVTAWQHPQKRVIQKYERVCHRRYKQYISRSNGEWFNLNDELLNELIIDKPNTQEQNEKIEYFLRNPLTV